MLGNNDNNNNFCSTHLFNRSFSLWVRICFRVIAICTAPIPDFAHCIQACPCVVFTSWCCSPRPHRSVNLRWVPCAFPLISLLSNCNICFCPWNIPYYLLPFQFSLLLSNFCCSSLQCTSVNHALSIARLTEYMCVKQVLALVRW